MTQRRIDSTLVNVADLTCLEDALEWACDRLARDIAEHPEAFAAEAALIDSSAA